MGKFKQEVMDQLNRYDPEKDIQETAERFDIGLEEARAIYESIIEETRFDIKNGNVQFGEFLASLTHSKAKKVAEEKYGKKKKKK